MTAFCSRSYGAETTPLMNRSFFPADAHALIYRTAPSVTMSARQRTPSWKLQFERRSPLRNEPLMGWTEDDDPLALVELSFPSAEAAIAYAGRQGLRYTVLGSQDKAPPDIALTGTATRPVFANRPHGVRANIARALSCLKRITSETLRTSAFGWPTPCTSTL